MTQTDKSDSAVAHQIYAPRYPASKRTTDLYVVSQHSEAARSDQNSVSDVNSSLGFIKDPSPDNIKTSRERLRTENQKAKGKAADPSTKDKSPPSPLNKHNYKSIRMTEFAF